MNNGPSKEDLELYWQNSRQYFDELANHYRQADPDYYNKYMKPFYDNPFRSQGNSYNQQISRSQGGSGKIILIAFVLLAVIGIAGAAVFFILYNSGTDIQKKFENITEQEKNVPQEKIPEVKQDELSPEEDPGSLSDEDKLILGAKFIGEKKYDKAAFYLKQIPPGSKKYKEAQQLLESIKYIRKYEKK